MRASAGSQPVVAAGVGGISRGGYGNETLVPSPAAVMVNVPAVGTVA